MVVITLLLFTQAILISSEEKTVVITVILVVVFEFGPGPICWIYMSEIMNDKGVAVATSLNWAFCLFYTLITPVSFEKEEKSVPYVMASACGVAALFVIVYVKETRGLTEQELT